MNDQCKTLFGPNSNYDACVVSKVALYIFSLMKNKKLRNNNMILNSLRMKIFVKNFIVGQMMIYASTLLVNINYNLNITLIGKFLI
jgi:hypothetical protein